ncbi:MAG: rod shape-determining protein MreD [Woeseia sp.]
MAERQSVRRVPVLISIIIAMMFAIAPLPESFEPFRPDWVLLILIYWTMALPRNFGVGSAWITGLVLDVAQGTLLGQHALALSAVVFLTVRFHLQLRVFPLSQLTITVAALIGLYQFILFWINGVAGISTDSVRFWGPAVSGTLLWPLVYLLFGTVSYRRRSP